MGVFIEGEPPFPGRKVVLKSPTYISGRGRACMQAFFIRLIVAQIRSAKLWKSRSSVGPVRLGMARSLRHVWPEAFRFCAKSV